jgi:hypothetical protein
MRNFLVIYEPQSQQTFQADLYHLKGVVAMEGGELHAEIPLVYPLFTCFIAYTVKRRRPANAAKTRQVYEVLVFYSCGTEKIEK